MDFIEINKRINALIMSGLVNPHIGIVRPAVPVTIESVNNHALRHGVTLEQAQNYVNSAKIMFGQGNRNMYLSDDGSATVLVEGKRLISAYSRENFDLSITAILEVLDYER
ncbi:MAG: hypothetical protein LBM98_07665 [Oscillospiraceae bacterium]|jgi:hypothetical protein|nr:hypothetical protein [Oscillospiraceae bacterium]